MKGRGMVSIICIGNEYQLDDGFGPAVARLLEERYDFGGAARVLDRAVMGYGVVSDLRECDVALVVDALDGTGAPAGTIFSFAPEDMAVGAGMVSLHEVRFADVLASARIMGVECTGRCFGVQVAERGDGLLARGLSEPVAAAVGPVAATVARYTSSTCGVAVEDRWRRSRDPRAVLDDPAAYLAAAADALGLAPDACERLVCAARPGMADYEADDLIERELDAARA